jgi:uncharacterized protein (TIGR00296 family)
MEIKNKSDDYKELPIFCFDLVLTTLKNKGIESLTIPEKFKDKNYPLFITWLKGKSKELRGCIGTFTPEDLETNLVKYTYFAAFKDTRFKPISMTEIHELHCGVSLLVDFEDAKDIYDWEVGKHGITIDFKDKKGKSYHGTFLPEVAGDRNWDKDTTLEHLLMKSGNISYNF